MEKHKQAPELTGSEENPRSSREYQIFRIPKRRGGFRQIEAPKDELKMQQRTSLQLLERVLPVSPFAHAFRPYRSIASMAAPHVGKPCILSIDIKSFFPSIKYTTLQEALHRVLPARARVPKADRVAMTEKVFEQLGMHFIKFKDEEPRLPQGGPASPLSRTPICSKPTGYWRGGPTR